MPDSIDWMTRSKYMAATCKGCSAALAKGQEVCVLTTQVSIMRGDDLVEILCRECAVNHGYTAPQPKIERQKRGLRGEIVGLERKLAEARAKLAKLEGAN